MYPVETALSFVEAINRNDTASLFELMTPEHVFVDALDHRITGRDVMLEGWNLYFRIVPDYHIQISDIFERGNEVAMIGRAGGTYARNDVLDPADWWEVPAAWKVVVEGDRVSFWQVFADNEPLRQLMNKKKRRKV